MVEASQTSPFEAKDKGTPMVSGETIFDLHTAREGLKSVAEVHDEQAEEARRLNAEKSSRVLGQAGMQPIEQLPVDVRNNLRVAIVSGQIPQMRQMEVSLRNAAFEEAA